MTADGGTPPVRVAEAGQGAVDPEIALQGNLLAYRRALYDANIWRLELKNGQPASAPVRLVASTASDTAPDYSPDGRRVVFASTRSGTFEIWACNADGSSPARVSTLDAPMSGSPKWSPDGRTIAFDSNLGGNEEIYTVSADGGPVKRITNHPGFDVVPTWSRDGRWIYFTSDRSGSRQIWKMPAAGGEPTQVTRGGGVNAMESADGRTLYFARDIGVPGPWRMPVGGGEETAVPDAAAGAVWGQMVLTEDGIYFIARDGTDLPLRYAIYFSDFTSRKTTRIYQLAMTLSLSARGLALSPDRHALLFTQLDASGADLMLLEHFR
jgi:dipeptidyl aminopeptidase/acylaminoacyl peptidase